MWSKVTVIILGLALLTGLSKCRHESKVAESSLENKKKAELLGEIVTVLFGTAKIDSLNQDEINEAKKMIEAGASLEGVYSRLAFGESYRKLESVKLPASETWLLEFDHQMNLLESSSQLKIQLEIATPWIEGARGASIYRLKRWLGQAGIQVIDRLKAKDSHPELELWYSKWAAKEASEAISFGLPQRKNPSEAFHLAWAKGVPEDLLRWEVLNRLHRILNGGIQTWNH